MTRAIYSAVLLVSLHVSVAQGIASPQTDLSSAASLDKLSSLLMPKFGKVRFHREEQLEDRLFTRDQVHSHPSSVPRIF